MQFPQTILSLTTLITAIAAHGTITVPPSRHAGNAMKAACGMNAYNHVYYDIYSNIQLELQNANGQVDYNAAACNAWLCKGLKYADNSANVQTYTAGQVVPITVDIRAPHTGVANVSIVDTALNKVIGAPLKSWSLYADVSTPIPADQKQFSITIPTGLGSKCTTPGACVIQWMWDARSIDQTYAACVDFTVAAPPAIRGRRF